MKREIKVAFLDRDGVINSSKINNGYVGYIKDFRWIPGSKKTIKYLKNLGYKIVIVTNQSGVARGYFSAKDVEILHKYVQSELRKIGTKVDKFFYCPFHKDGIIKRYKKKSKLRKPDIGMFLKVKKIWNIDKKNSFMVGDQMTDMQFAKKAGIQKYFFDKNNLYSFIKKKIF
jgi:D-glycero-D-manno-heptose 1,7-bisphosphate phosphatase|tara:strand:+ start:113 stop:628 length:516 start_codon:yes stop_codon:yes gene_type:complete